MFSSNFIGGRIFIFSMKNSSQRLFWSKSEDFVFGEKRRVFVDTKREELKGNIGERREDHSTQPLGINRFQKGLRVSVAAIGGLAASVLPEYFIHHIPQIHQRNIHQQVDQCVQAQPEQTTLQKIEACLPILNRSEEVDVVAVLQSFGITEQDLTSCQSFLHQQSPSALQEIQTILQDEETPSNIKNACQSLYSAIENNEQTFDIDHIQEIQSYLLTNGFTVLPRFLVISLLLFFLLSSKTQEGKTASKIAKTKRRKVLALLGIVGALGGLTSVLYATGWGARAIFSRNDNSSTEDTYTVHGSDTHTLRETDPSAETPNVEKVEAILAEKIEEMSPSLRNKVGMCALGGLFTVDLAKALGGQDYTDAAWKRFGPSDQGIVGRVANYYAARVLDHVTKVNPASGVAMYGLAQARIADLHRSTNPTDREYAHHEAFELSFAENGWMIPFFTVLAHFAEQGIQVSPDTERIIKDLLPSFNALSGGYQLVRGQERPRNNAEQQEWINHYQKSKEDVLKASGDILVYSAAPSVLIFPSVYTTSSLAEGPMDRLQMSYFEYFLAQAKIAGKDDATACEYAMIKTNDNMEKALKFKMAFVDNIFAGLGVDGPVPKTLLALLHHGGVESFLQYYAMMIPQIMKYSGTTFNAFIADTLGGTEIITEQASIVTHSIGETIWNGAHINLYLLQEMGQQVLESSQSSDQQNAVHANRLQHMLSDEKHQGEKEVWSEIRHYLSSQTRDTAFAFDFSGAVKDLVVHEVPSWIRETAQVLDPRNTTTEPRDETKSEKALVAEEKGALTHELHTLLVDRFAALEHWTDTDTVGRKDILEQLIADDDYLRELVNGDLDHNPPEEEKLHKALFVVLSQSTNRYSKAFQRMLLCPDGETAQYPHLKEVHYSDAIREALKKFVKSHRLHEVKVQKRHKEAAKEVFGALTDQLTGAAIGVSIARWAMSESIQLTGVQSSQISAHLADALAGKNLEVPEQDLQTLLEEQNVARGTLSEHASHNIEIALLSFRECLQAYPNTALSNVLETFTRALQAIYATPRREEVVGALEKIYIAGGSATPVADNIAAVVFMISAGFEKVRQAFGEETLKKKVSLSRVPGLGGVLRREMTIGDALIIMAGMLGINLGSGTPYGNGVQLGESLRTITQAGESGKIGDFESEKHSILENIKDYLVTSNPYAATAMTWTIADVQVLFTEVSNALIGNAENDEHYAKVA
jgi:hypothetical protein